MAWTRDTGWGCVRRCIPPAGALEIGQALPIHAGRYTCTARNPAGVAHKHVFLTVRGRVARPSAQTAVALGAGGWGGR